MHLLRGLPSRISIDAPRHDRENDRTYEERGSLQQTVQLWMELLTGSKRNWGEGNCMATGGLAKENRSHCKREIILMRNSSERSSGSFMRKISKNYMIR